tara:strand:+ start:389 stop:703 length:315 start_codon:yes stop_codon:yes gene_type:complete
MLGLSAFGETTFGGLGHAGAVILVTGSGVTVSQGTPTYAIDGTAVVTGSGVTISMGTITLTISGSVTVTGSGLTVSDGAEEVNVITWPAIDPGVSMTWTNIDPL